VVSSAISVQTSGNNKTVAIALGNVTANSGPHPFLTSFITIANLLRPFRLQASASTRRMPERRHDRFNQPFDGSPHPSARPRTTGRTGHKRRFTAGRNTASFALLFRSADPPKRVQDFPRRPGRPPFGLRLEIALRPSRHRCSPGRSHFRTRNLPACRGLLPSPL